MGSFYGHGWGTGNGEGGSGTSNYNDLSNKPIVNLLGTESSPVNLSDLEYGNYLIKGFYRYSASDENRQSISLSVSVSQDTASDDKVAKFEVIENQEVIVITVFYSNDGTFVESRFALGGNSGEYSHIAEEVVLGTF